MVLVHVPWSLEFVDEHLVGFPIVQGQASHEEHLAELEELREENS